MNYNTIYDSMFKLPYYNVHDFNEPRYNVVIKYINDNRNMIKNIIDIGSGRGKLLQYLQKEYNNINIISCDINNYHNIDNITFYKIDLSDINSYININKQDLLTCLDVMEHLDKSFIEDVLLYFSKISKFSIITIANHSDIINNIELHTIQEDDRYWSPIIQKYFKIKNITEEYIVNSKPKLYIYYLESLY